MLRTDCHGLENTFYDRSEDKTKMGQDAGIVSSIPVALNTVGPVVILNKINNKTYVMNLL